MIQTTSRNLSVDEPLTDSMDHYSNLLREFGFEYTRSENYLEVGEVDWVQGWILDVGVVFFQVMPLLECILPLLKGNGVAFRLVRNSDVAKSVLAGAFGYVELGKIVSIYPSSSTDALKLASDLIALTQAFKGPEILTDRQLAGVVFTHFGAYKPIVRTNHQNIEEHYIYSPTGELVRDVVTIPFRLPDGVSWPFYAIVSPRPDRSETVLQDRYKPMEVLKEDARGYVKKGLMLEKGYRIRRCVIKEGRRNMETDRYDRNIHDRLEWQFELQKDLEEYIPLPKAYDFFEENGNSYLVMDFVRGIPIIDVVTDVFKGRLWCGLMKDEKVRLLNYTDQILAIVGKMHGKGYIHRDIMPNNFLVDREQKLWLIDLELAYSEVKHKPFPPFLLGTPGFMSPEQLAGAVPAQAQDVYAVGALLVLMFTGLYPNGFSLENASVLEQQLLFHINDQEICDVILNCLSVDAAERPAIGLLTAVIQKFRERQLVSGSGLRSPRRMEKNGELIDIVKYAINGLASPAFTNEDLLWCSRKSEDEALSYRQSRSTRVYKGFSQGLSGIVYVLAKAQLAGLSIRSCLDSYMRSVNYIRPTLGGGILEAVGGLYTGTSGMAVALVEGLRSGLITHEEVSENDLLGYLGNGDLQGFGVANGLAGSGIALLHSDGVIQSPERAHLVDGIIERLIASQQSDGSWLSMRTNSRNAKKSTGWRDGIGGIAFFLLTYFDRSRDRRLEVPVGNALKWLVRHRKVSGGRWSWFAGKSGYEGEENTFKCNPGLILCLIKAYEVFGDATCRQMVETALRTMPDPFFSTDITLATGVTGLGELYLEAARVFKSEEWYSRAQGIADTLAHYFVSKEDKACYWLTKETNFTSADLISGNAGIVHFLLRCCFPNRFAHPLTIL